MGAQPDHRLKVEKNVVNVMYLAESVLQRFRHFMKILCKISSQRKVALELQKPSMLTNQNYNEYLFDGGTDYMRNEVRSFIWVACDYDLTNFKGGGGSMYSQVHIEFMAFIEQAQSAYYVDIEDCESYDYVQTTLFT